MRNRTLLNSTIPTADSLPPLPIELALWRAVAVSLGLSPQHTRVVELVLRGMCDKQIADAMGIHKSTLRTYFDRIAVRIGCHGRIGIMQKVLTVSHQVRGGVRIAADSKATS